MWGLVKLHPDTNFALTAFTVFALVAVLLPMSMLAAGCHMMAADLSMPSQGLHFSGLCDMVQDPALPDAATGSLIAAITALFVALAIGIAALVLPNTEPTRAVIPVAAAPPWPPEPPLGERLRL